MTTTTISGKKNNNIIITGVTGQDGSLMADFLLKNTDFFILGGARRLSNTNHKNIEHLKLNHRFRLIDLDITDPNNIEQAIDKEKPDYFINFAANSFVGNSWTMPINHMHTNCLAVLYQLEAIRKFAPNCRYYNAGSSEEFGDVVNIPQDENHPLRPRSPYGASKAAARMLVKVYRDSYRLYAIQGFLFNHEGDRRGIDFVTRKITSNVARIKKALDTGTSFEPLELGNLDAKRDWSDAEDFIEGIWLMLNQDKPWSRGLKVENSTEEITTEFLSKYIKEYVLSSNETHTIREFVELSFIEANIHGTWIGDGLNERYVLKNDPNITLLRINPQFYRPAEVDLLLGNSSLARTDLGWKPKTNFAGLVRKMVINDLNEI
jgi:GDPmannose 4,6-dehydratase